MEFIREGAGPEFTLSGDGLGIVATPGTRRAALELPGKELGMFIKRGA